MEKTKRSKSKIFSFLPKTARVSFSNPSYSPGRERRQENLNKFKHNAGKGFSGPIISIIPVEARRKTRNGSFDTQEPTSPKVSCIGQIKHKKRICKAKFPSPKQEKVKKEKPKLSPKFSSSFARIFLAGRRSDVKAEKVDLPARDPTLSQLKQFSSGRSAFADFDWRADGGRNYFSDEERDQSDEEEEEDFIPHSAPLGVGGRVALGPRKEVSIWKRRTMDRPKPLQLDKLAKDT
ncbi:uncharacterized protein At1g76070-like [Tasmannia lanceolata]|uniref:uncharacterized protein At1g76070-like n=1 Tax=Tasmannia lanceolata TaxID=3420 RepID=UPI0040628F21